MLSGWYSFHVDTGKNVHVGMDGGVKWSRGGRLLAYQEGTYPMELETIVRILCS